MQHQIKTAARRFGVTPIIALGYGLYYVSDTWNSRFETQGYGALCAAILGVLAVFLAVRALRQGMTAVAIAEWVAVRPKVLRDHRWAIAMTLSLAAYVWAQQAVGFLPATGAMFLWLLFFLKAGSVPKVVALAAMLTALAWVILLKLLNVPLPSGPFGS
ncbi:MAG: tripartite tricarboxylate transporter TctB family protein [Pseudomonadota bacterium]